jgi:probable rRNA maturation factor
MGLTIAVVDGRGRPIAASGIEAWLRRTAPASARGVVTIAIVSDAAMQALNRTYRGKDYATDVLSFPDDRSAAARRLARGAARLGDLAIARGVARRQARAAGHDLRTELRVLSLHGLLHLMGYDHERDNGRMRRLEQRLRRKGGLATGLIERNAGRRAGRR